MSDQSLAFNDFIYHPNNYGLIDYRVLQMGDHTVAYLTPRGVRQTAALGKKLFNEEYSRNLIKRVQRHLRSLRQTKILLRNVETLNKRGRLYLWKTTAKRTDEFCYLYLYCEQPVLFPLEECVRQVAHNNKRLQQVLETPALAKKFGFPKKAQRALELLFIIGKYKLQLHLKFEPWLKELDAFIAYIGRTYHLSPKQALMLRREEITGILRGEQEPPLDELNRREHGCVLLPSRRGAIWRCYYGKRFDYWHKQLEQPRKNNITGTTVFPGKVRGRVRIHLSWTKIIKPTPGSILVTGMTNPQLLPYLKRVASIVTDEGGLTCHAAIISRELKIPCIVGTGNATKLLKDGDLVEVDANKGIVRKINKV